MYHSLNPPPIGPIISGDAALFAGSLGSSSASSMWPIRIYPDTILTNTTIQLIRNFYNYYIVYSNSPITLTLEIIPIGTIIIVEFTGSGSLGVVLDGTTLQTGNIPAGTYLISKFKDNARYTKLSNPTEP